MTQHRIDGEKWSWTRSGIASVSGGKRETWAGKRQRLVRDIAKGTM
jgi:hypothetical protein